MLFLFTKLVLSGWVILLLVWGDDHLTEWRVMAIHQTSHMALTPKQNLFNLLDRLWLKSQVMLNRCQERWLGYLLEQKCLYQSPRGQYFLATISRWLFTRYRFVEDRHQYN